MPWILDLNSYGGEKQIWAFSLYTDQKYTTEWDFFTTFLQLHNMYMAKLSPYWSSFHYADNVTKYNSFFKLNFILIDLGEISPSERKLNNFIPKQWIFWILNGTPPSNSHTCTPSTTPEVTCLSSILISYECPIPSKYRNIIVL